MIFEGDCLSSYGIVIEDIRSQALVFEACVFAHTSRVCNCVADAIAKNAKAFRSAQV